MRSFVFMMLSCRGRVAFTRGGGLDDDVAMSDAEETRRL
jgi:hypothetical protein